MVNSDICKSVPMSPSRTILSALAFLVFTTFDLLDWLLCFLYRFADSFFDGCSYACCCCRSTQREEKTNSPEEDEEDRVSETLYYRRNIFREFGSLAADAGTTSDDNDGAKVRSSGAVRWSDCHCELCVSWQAKGKQKLHYVVKEPDSQERHISVENVLFLHGFLSSSALWEETVFTNLSSRVQQRCRLVAVDLLGFGQSPKPPDCLYRLKDHVNAIERFVLDPLQLKPFHLVAHSMGCVIAVALAAKHPEWVNSLTLVAPPYFPGTKDNAAQVAMHRLAGKKLWPPMLFGTAVMSWYEHVGRTMCLILCRNHRFWEWLMKLITGKRDLGFMFQDLTRHTHHSAWNTMHNVICGGAKLMEEYLEILAGSETRIRIIHGCDDQVVPPECGFNMNKRLLSSQLQVVPNAGHDDIILGREREFVHGLEYTWFSEH